MGNGRFTLLTDTWTNWTRIYIRTCPNVHCPSVQVDKVVSTVYHQLTSLFVQNVQSVSNRKKERWTNAFCPKIE